MSLYPITWITKSLGVGYAPMSYAELTSIKQQGIDAIVNLCAEFSDLHELEEASGFEVCYLPVWDEDIPKMKDMEKALEWLDESIYLGKKILVHCRHGIGRTGTFVTSYMIRKGLGLKSASKKLKSSNANPSNYSQWKLVKKYGKKSGILKIRVPSLEFKNRVDLSQYFSDYAYLLNNLHDREVSTKCPESEMPGLNDNERIQNQSKNSPVPVDCGCGKHKCCSEPFDLQLIEVVYIHSKMNKLFKSDQRQAFIETAAKAKTSGIENSLCPFNDGQSCNIFTIRPVRCRTYGLPELSADSDEIKGMLLELSKTLFLAFSGQFLPDNDFTFSMADTISGKFVQKIFHYMSEIEKKD